MGLQLYFGSILVGYVEGPFEHQGTWFGMLRRVPLDEGEPTQRRLSEYLTFCQAWHDRLAAGEEPEASEFDAFSDVLTSGLWYARDEREAVTPIREAPVLVDDELSWQTA